MMINLFGKKSASPASMAILPKVSAEAQRRTTVSGEFDPSCSLVALCRCASGAAGSRAGTARR